MITTLSRAVVGLLVFGVVGVVLVAVQFVFTAPGQRSETVIFTVEPGQSLREVSEKLYQAKMTSSPTQFRWFAKLTGFGRKVKVGEYALNRGMTPKSVLEVLASGKSILYPFTVREGESKYEIADLVQAKGIAKKDEFLNLTRDPDLIRTLLPSNPPVINLEGYLYPETYYYTRFTSARDLIAMMVARFQSVYQREIAPLNQKNWSREQIVVLASMIEKETGAPEERPMISSVFHNRLEKRMRLQSDPTILYGILDASGSVKANITREDILRPTPYNTYTRFGLPVGPIGNPGVEALKAALKPQSSNYLYFVSRNDGTHVFSKTYAEHNENVKKYQLDPKARAGKSWRDLKTRGKASTSAAK